MPRKKLIRTREHVYHITTRSNSKEWFYIPQAECWKICLAVLEAGQKEFKIELHAFVLMSNHYHMLLRTPTCDIDAFMQFFNKTLSLRINMSIGRVNHVFGTPYKWSIVNNQKYYANALKYIYQNPVRAGITETVESYPYSTLKQHFLSKKQAQIRMSCYLQQLDLQWLNNQYSADEVIGIRKGLKRASFRPIGRGVQS